MPIQHNTISKRFKILCMALTGMLLLWIGNTVSVNANPRLQQTSTPIRIVIDPGHGGDNKGTEEFGHLEKEMTMVTALAMYDRLSQFDDVEVFLTHTDDIDLSLKERADFAASVNADFVFSIHYNASEFHTLFGSEVWVSCQEPFNSYGYQFGCYQMEEMRDMGLFLRGIKTRLNNKGTDYYGIIRQNAELGIPAVIIEHCHVDHEEDMGYCDADSKLIEFGQKDATAVAKYFGLKSTSLGLDYSNSNSEFDRSTSSGKVASTFPDETEPDVCEIKLKELDKENGIATIQVTGADYDSPLLYYDYSFDGGETYSSLQKWPGSDAYAWKYNDTFETQITLPAGTPIRFILRASNFSDKTKESNMIPMPSVRKVEEEATPVFLLQEEGNPSGEEGLEKATNSDSVIPSLDDKDIVTVDLNIGEQRFDPDEGDDKFIWFILACVFIVALMFAIVTISQIISNRRHKKRVAKRKKQREDWEM